jgi:hypothetical protein
MSGFSGTANLMNELARQTQKLSWTGDTSEKILLTVNIPPLGANSYLDITSLFSMTNNSNSKTLRVRLGGIGGTVVMSSTAANLASFTDIHRTIVNRNATNAQICTSAAVTIGGSTGTVATPAIETNAGTTLVFTVQLTNASDTASLEYAIVNLAM